MLVTKILENDGYFVTHVENGREAIAACENNHFDFILMDYHMPVMDGLTAIKAIRMRQEEGGEYTPIFMLSADSGEIITAASTNAGACKILQKPLTIDALALAFNALPKNVA